MKKDRRKGRAARRAVVYTAATAALTMTLQMGFTFPSLAYYGYGSDYGNDYPYRDDPDYGNYYYWDESGRKVTNVTRTYDDGTKYWAEYRYDALGHLVYSNVKQTDGSKTTLSKTYNGELPVSETSYEYDASSKSELTNTIQYGGDGYPVHQVYQEKYKDGTGESGEVWYLSYNVPLRTVLTGRTGVVTQTDYTYTDQGQQLGVISVSSNGSTAQEEWQYDGEGNKTYYKSTEFDAVTRTAKVEERRYEGGNYWSTYDLDAMAYEDGTVYKTETWRRAEDNRVVKRVVTDLDGSQTTENYSYDMNGDETLYTKTDGSGIVEKRETANTTYGSRTVQTDRSGAVSMSSEEYDPKTGSTTIESTTKGPDGYYVYRKVIRGEDYNREYDVYQVKDGSGSEYFEETSYHGDGSMTRTERSDGKSLVTRYDSNGNKISASETLPDGTRSEIAWEYREDGYQSSEIKKYSDGSQDRIDYEYNESGRVVRETETRRNGVSAVSQYQLDSRGYGTGVAITFSNGYQVVSTSQDLGDGGEQGAVVFSTGDIAQIVLVSYENGPIACSILYRDGRTEGFSANLYDEDGFVSEGYNKLKALDDYYESYIEQAWNSGAAAVVDSPALEPAVPASAAPVLAAGDGGETVTEEVSLDLGASEKVAMEAEVSGPGAFEEAATEAEVSDPGASEEAAMESESLSPGAV